jgi:hypothetical protein
VDRDLVARHSINDGDIGQMADRVGIKSDTSHNEGKAQASHGHLQKAR